jgi:hypothetical protein
MWRSLRPTLTAKTQRRSRRGMRRRRLRRPASRSRARRSCNPSPRSVTSKSRHYRFGSQMRMKRTAMTKRCPHCIGSRRTFLGPQCMSHADKDCMYRMSFRLLLRICRQGMPCIPPIQQAVILRNMYQDCKIDTMLRQWANIGQLHMKCS